jgi:asparagine synthetase B (glutamine-hydrolysing)
MMDIMQKDIQYCMSSFLQFRTIADREKTFSYQVVPSFFNPITNRIPIKKSTELYDALKSSVIEATEDGRAALALSGGIDSAILAKFMPKNSIAYTFKCVVPGFSVIDETAAAAVIASECGLELRVIEIYWEDFDRYLPSLMLKKGAPIHSIEVQIHKAALKAKQDGFEGLIFGEAADCLYGGQDQLFSRIWKTREFEERYPYVNTEQVLVNPKTVVDVFTQYSKDGYIDIIRFMAEFFYPESCASYQNPCDVAGIEFLAPYAKTIPQDLDLNRIRSGDYKYLVREVFSDLYPNKQISKKTPMPRPMNEWLQNWEGPRRPEFIFGCTKELAGDQKWLVYCLEKYLDLLEAEGLS